MISFDVWGRNMPPSSTRERDNERQRLRETDRQTEIFYSYKKYFLKFYRLTAGSKLRGPLYM